jgi:hypothetical protein
MAILLSFFERLCHLCCEGGKGNSMVLSLNDKINHIQLMHKDKRVTFQCTKCSKTYKSKHGAQCHMPKCRGQNALVEDNRSFACNSCDKAFATKVRLSQHERHEHPLVRNAARVAEASSSKEMKHQEALTKYGIRTKSS